MPLLQAVLAEAFDIIEARIGFLTKLDLFK
jgi:hypothetical protein